MGLKIFGAWLAVMAAAYAAWTGWTMYQVRAAKARCRAAELPMTLAELRPPVVPNEVNARVALEELAAKTKTEPLASWLRGDETFLWLKGLRRPARALSDAELFKLSALLEDPAPKAILDAARDAAKRQDYWPRVEYPTNDLPVGPGVAVFTDVVELLGARALLAASRGNRNAAGADLSAALTLALYPAREPTVLGPLTSWACLGLWAGWLERVCALRGLPMEAVGDLGSRLHRFAATADLAHAVDAERVLLGEQSFERLLSHRDAKIDDLVFDGAGLGFAYRLLGLGRLDFASYLDHLRRIRLELADSAHSPREQIDGVEKISADVSRHHVLTAAVVATLATLTSKAWSAQMRAAVIEVGLALERYRTTNGRYPENLDALTPDYLTEIPRDAFAGQRLVYRGTREGALIYSVGKNRRDDGGVFDDPAEKDDIAWELGAPDRPARE